MNALSGLAFIPVVLGMAMWQPTTPEDAPKPRRNLTFQEQRWYDAQIRSQWASRVDAAVDLYARNKWRYERVSDMRGGAVPARVIFVLHGRESTWSFAHHLHEGSTLRARTRWVPKGRPKTGSPPFTWEESAEDALYTLKGMERWDWGNMHSMLQNIETYNGLGYQRYHKSVPSPYLWSGTTVYSRGKYVADGKFSSLAVDKQLGCAAILKRMQERGIR